MAGAAGATSLRASARSRSRSIDVVIDRRQLVEERTGKAALGRSHEPQMPFGQARESPGAAGSRAGRRDSARSPTSRSHRQWVSPATRLKTTPDEIQVRIEMTRSPAPPRPRSAPSPRRRRPGSRARRATSRPPRSSPRRSGRPRPSKQPITPSMSARSAPAAWRATVARTCSREHIQPSRLYDGRPATSAWKPGSTKSGPTLNGWTVTPRRRSVSSRPRVTVVFPTPLPTPAMTSAGIIGPRKHRGEARRDQDGAHGGAKQET